MRFSLIICTYMRPQAILRLLQSVEMQTMYPKEIVVIDGSVNELTEKILSINHFENLKYFKVEEKDRGLTRQRNFGIAKVDNSSEIVFFLDDDTVLEANYFEEILKAYKLFPQALGVGGYINNEVLWEKVNPLDKIEIDIFAYDGWKRTDGSRFVLRKKLGLDSNAAPGFSPAFSHGRSIGFLPPSGKIYEVEQLMGGVSSFRKEVFQKLQFSTYFDGYGLYEDADFTLRLSKIGKLYVNTSAQLSHHHALSGRPNHYKYGKMVVRNGWYVWRVKNPNPSLKVRLKWNAITLLLTFIRFGNVLTTEDKQGAFKEALGRMAGWLNLCISKPLIIKDFINEDRNTGL